MKTIKVLLIGMLFFMGGQVFAQGGANPFVNSTHNYKVNGGTVTTDYTYFWEVLKGGVATTGLDLTLGTNGGASIDITWLLADTYTVRLTETASAADGGCATLREFEVVVGGNEFDISIADLGTDCSGADGIIVNIGHTNLSTTIRTFTIDMTTVADKANMPAAAFKPDWKFNYKVTSTAGDLVSAIVDADNTTVTGTALAGKVATGTVNVTNADFSVTITVEFNNVWDTDESLSVALDEGYELTYNTPEKDATSYVNNTGVVVVNAIPATTEIETDI